MSGPWLIYPRCGAPVNMDISCPSVLILRNPQAMRNLSHLRTGRSSRQRRAPSPSAKSYDIMAGEWGMISTACLATDEVRARDRFHLKRSNNTSHTEQGPHLKEQSIPESIWIYWYIRKKHTYYYTNIKCLNTIRTIYL